MIETERLFLRRAKLDDLKDLHQVFSSPQAMRYWDSLPYTRLSQTEDLLRAMVGSAGRNSDDFMIEHQGRVIGKAGCWCKDEIGFILHPEHWGKGLAYEALSAVIPHNFAHLAIDTIKADVDPRNYASLKLLDRLGFKETGRASRTIQVGGKWCDSVYLVLQAPSGK